MSDKVNLATFEGTDILEVDGHTFIRGIQYEVTNKMATRLASVPGMSVVKTAVGSNDDVRPPDDTPVEVTGAEDAPTEVPAEDAKDDTDNTTEGNKE